MNVFSERFFQSQKILYFLNKVQRKKSILSYSAFLQSFLFLLLPCDELGDELLKPKNEIPEDWRVSCKHDLACLECELHEGEVITMSPHLYQQLRPSRHSYL